MNPDDVKPYSESYQHLWKHRENYQEFRFILMNMMVDDAYDKVEAEARTIIQKLVDELSLVYNLSVIYKLEAKIAKVKEIIDSYDGNMEILNRIREVLK